VTLQYCVFLHEKISCVLQQYAGFDYPESYLTQRALLLDDGTPVVGMTLRFDRLDYFWFILLHELAHVIKRLGVGDTTCILAHEAGIENLEARETETNE
jgi:HTH-type transcriptional regulator/antitoxin HigA